MKNLGMRLIAGAFALILVCCSESGSKDGDAARSKFESRTNLELPANVACQYKWVQVGDTYGEYYRFDCTSDYAKKLVEKLSLEGAGAFDPTPNDPTWWKGPSAGVSVHEKDGYSDIAHGSRMTFWYNSDESAGYLDINFWD